MRTTGLCALALMLILTGSIPAVAQDDDEDDAQDGLLDEAPDDAGPPPTEATLAPYGQWIDDPGYGRVWQPTVAFAWRPYTYGHWAWGPFGWTWVSVEPWGCTFHYGRWALAPTGWVWVPGTVWGPAWVDWYWGDGFVGWAPLGPSVTHVTVIDRFVFVPEHRFCAHRIGNVVVDSHHIPAPVFHDWGRHDFRPPRRDHIERVADHPVERWHGRPPAMAGGGQHRLGRERPRVNVPNVQPIGIQQPVGIRPRPEVDPVAPQAPRDTREVRPWHANRPVPPIERAGAMPGRAPVPVPHAGQSVMVVPGHGFHTPAGRPQQGAHAAPREGRAAAHRRSR